MNDETIAEMVQNWLSAAGNGLIAQTPDELVSRIKGREQWIKGEIEWRDKLIYTHLDNLNKAEARLLSLQVDRSKAVKLRDDTDNVIWALKPEDVPGAINWGDLGVREVQEVIDEERRWYRVIIEEADPSNQVLHAAVTAGLAALGWNTDDIELETAW